MSVVAPPSSASLSPRQQIHEDAHAVPYHYDLPPDLFSCFLDPRMNYSCCYFARPEDSLAQAGERKLLLCSRKLRLSSHDHLLDIGCGWGNMLFFAAERYGARATGITLSPEQARYIRQTAKERGLEPLIQVEVAHALELPYRDGSFSRIVTIGAIEHIRNLDLMFQECHRVLTDDGLMLVHGMAAPWECAVSEKPSYGQRWIEQHIFHIIHLESISAIARMLEEARFEIVDVENISDHYALTLRAWVRNVQEREAEIVQRLGSEEAYRTLLLYLAGCVDSFEHNGTFCYQTLTRKLVVDEPRQPLPLGRQYMTDLEAGVRQGGNGHE